MRISGIIDESIVDGEGIRTAIFMQGCLHDCKGCHNPETHPLDGGKEKTLEEIEKRILNNDSIDGITLTGGDPFYQLDAANDLLKMAKRHHLSTWVYTGYTFEELQELAKNDNRYQEILEKTDVLVDGRYMSDKRDISLLFRGSTNQRVIDVKESLKLKEVVLYLQ